MEVKPAGDETRMRKPQLLLGRLLTTDVRFWAWVQPIDATPSNLA